MPVRSARPSPRPATRPCSTETSATCCVRFSRPELRAAYPVWLAEYDAEVPTAPLDFSIWQYTNAGTVPGIPTDVDLNVWLGAKQSKGVLVNINNAILHVFDFVSCVNVFTRTPYGSRK